MKILTAITFALAILGLFTSISIVSDYTNSPLGLVCFPYGLLIALLLYVNIANKSKSSKVSLFISACLNVLMSIPAYWGVVYGTSHSSTEALIFLVVPIYGVGLILIVYGVIRLVSAMPAIFRFIKEVVNSPYEH